MVTIQMSCGRRRDEDRHFNWSLDHDPTQKYKGTATGAKDRDWDQDQDQDHRISRTGFRTMTVTKSGTVTRTKNGNMNYLDKCNHIPVYRPLNQTQYRNTDELGMHVFHKDHCFNFIIILKVL